MRLSGLIIVAFFSITASAQITLVDELERFVQDKGKIIVIRDVRLDSLIGVLNKNNSQKQIKAVGYRIQVFAGNNTRESRNLASQAEVFIRKNYPDLPVYNYFRSPRWICAVGDFVHYEEAYAVMRKLRKETTYKGLIILRNQEIRIDL
ncbi:MAG TPA: SPOR domain-containing protein [Bacteroidaceae bacterium]|nr:SPOR domain-containing protein [Bacteroidaceae bacterium]